MQMGQHRNVRLQRAWNKYGEDAFSFRVLAVLEIDHLVETEQRLLDRVIGPKCYNIALDASAPMRGRRHSADTLAKMSRSKKGRVISWADKISAAKKGVVTDKQRAANTARRGKPIEQRRTWSAEQRAEHSLKVKVWWAAAAPEDKARISRKGFKHSRKTRRAMSETRKGKPRGPFTEEHRAKLRGPKSPEHRAKMSAVRIGKRGRPQGEAEREAKRQKMKAIWAAKKAAS